MQNKAYQIGIQLGIPYDRMQQFKQDVDILSCVINYWLKGNIRGAPITWKFLAETLQSDYVDESGIASTIITEYCQRGDFTRNSDCKYTL